MSQQSYDRHKTKHEARCAPRKKHSLGHTYRHTIDPRTTIQKFSRASDMVSQRLYRSNCQMVTDSRILQLHNNSIVMWQKRWTKDRGRLYIGSKVPAPKLWRWLLSCWARQGTPCRPSCPESAYTWSIVAVAYATGLKVQKFQPQVPARIYDDL